MAETPGGRVSLLHLAEQCDDAAAGLVRFRESLPGHTTSITGLIAELFTISSVLRQAHADATFDAGRVRGTGFGHGFRRGERHSHSIVHDLGLVTRSLIATLHLIFSAFGALSRNAPEPILWERLNRRLCDEGFSFLDRLQLYRAALDALSRTRHEDVRFPRDFRQDLIELLAAQPMELGPHLRLSGASTPRLALGPHRTSRPMDVGDEWDDYIPADLPRFTGAPDPPISPTYTSTSSRTMSSSQTSYGSGRYSADAPGPPVHWAQDVFDGTNPLTRYQQPGSQLDDPSACFGNHEPEALHHLVQDGFQRALALPFDEERLWVRLYWRPEDYRARILVLTNTSRSGQLLYTLPLTSLKVIRDASCLLLCRARRSTGNYSLWARLNFIYHERMVLFYATFVGMKRQDLSADPHRSLLDRCELEAGDGDEADSEFDAAVAEGFVPDNRRHGENVLFVGQIRHGHMFHALRLLRDAGSGVVRLEALPLRGTKKDVPIWTAFVTKYGYDPDWAALEGHGQVSLAAVRPRPSVFIARYDPPQDRLHNYILPFTTDEDANVFMRVWTELCRTYGREL